MVSFLFSACIDVVVATLIFVFFLFLFLLLPLYSAGITTSTLPRMKIFIHCGDRHVLLNDICRRWEDRQARGQSLGVILINRDGTRGDFALRLPRYFGISHRYRGFVSG